MCADTLMILKVGETVFRALNFYVECYCLMIFAKCVWKFVWKLFRIYARSGRTNQRRSKTLMRLWGRFTLLRSVLETNWRTGFDSLTTWVL